MCAFSISITLITQVATVILLLLFAMAASSNIWAWGYCFGAPSLGNHSAFIILIVESCGCEASRPWRCREVVRCDRCWDRGRVSSLDFSDVGSPSRGAETGVVENRGVNINEALANAIFDVCQIWSPQLPNEKTARETNQQPYNLSRNFVLAQPIKRVIGKGVVTLTLRSEAKTWGSLCCSCHIIWRESL